MSRVRVLSPETTIRNWRLEPPPGVRRQPARPSKRASAWTAYATGAVRPGAAEQGADRMLAFGPGELNVASGSRGQRGEQALGLLDAMPAGFVRLAVDAVGELKVGARRLRKPPPQPIRRELRRKSGGGALQSWRGVMGRQGRRRPAERAEDSRDGSPR